MRGHVSIEEGALAALREVDVLIDDHHVPGHDLLLHRADGRERHDLGRSQELQRRDVRPVVDLVGRGAVTPAVPRQKEHFRVAVPRADHGVARRAKGRLDAMLFHQFEARDLVDPAAADHTQDVLHRVGPYHGARPRSSPSSDRASGLRRAALRRGMLGGCDCTLRLGRCPPGSGWLPPGLR